MDVIETRREDRTILELSGRLDTVTSGAFEKRVGVLIAAGVHRMVFDFSKVTFLSSAGLRAILYAWKQLAAKAGKLTLVVPAGPVRETLAVAGVISVLSIHRTQPEAVRACEPEAAGPGKA